MAKTKVPTEKCLGCRHFGFCLIPWGTECKRQGGRKIPRLKSLPFESWPNVKKRQEKTDRRVIKKYKSIKTKIVNWG